jgi:hypothetical protein
MKHHIDGNSDIVAPYFMVTRNAKKAPIIIAMLVSMNLGTNIAGINHKHKYIKKLALKSDQ